MPQTNIGSPSQNLALLRDRAAFYTTLLQIEEQRRRERAAQVERAGNNMMQMLVRGTEMQQHSADREDQQAFELERMGLNQEQAKERFAMENGFRSYGDMAEAVEQAGGWDQFRAARQANAEITKLDAMRNAGYEPTWYKRTASAEPSEPTVQELYESASPELRRRWDKLSSGVFEMSRNGSLGPRAMPSAMAAVATERDSILQAMRAERGTPKTPTFENLVKEGKIIPIPGTNSMLLPSGMKIEEISQPEKKFDGPSAWVATQGDPAKQKAFFDAVFPEVPGAGRVQWNPKNNMWEPLKSNENDLLKLLVPLYTSDAGGLNVDGLLQAYNTIQDKMNGSSPEPAPTSQPSTEEQVREAEYQILSSKVDSGAATPEEAVEWAKRRDERRAQMFQNAPANVNRSNEPGGPTVANRTVQPVRANDGSYYLPHDMPRTLEGKIDDSKLINGELYLFRGTYYLWDADAKEFVRMDGLKG